LIIVFGILVLKFKLRVSLSLSFFLLLWYEVIVVSALAIYRATDKSEAPSYLLTPLLSVFCLSSIPFHNQSINQIKVKALSISSVPSSHSRKHNHHQLKLVFFPYYTVLFFFLILHSTHTCINPHCLFPPFLLVWKTLKRKDRK